MKSTFERLYNATPFDPDSREDQIGEAARRTLIKAAIETDVTRSVCNGADMPYLLGGLLVGIAQIMKSAATGIPDDEIDAAIRVSIIQVAPWAVDMMRASQGKEPLANA
ncbi:MAG: hypothetical protein U5N55_11955 [Cypionkella sp.]|nr:hypothetical protein [Cypionkella sp.]